MMDEIESAFTQAKIKFFAVKGLEVAGYYPVPTLRTMGDCDIIVHESDRVSCHSTLQTFQHMNIQ